MGRLGNVIRLCAGAFVILDLGLLAACAGLPRGHLVNPRATVRDQADAVATASATARPLANTPLPSPTSVPTSSRSRIGRVVSVTPTLAMTRRPDWRLVATGLGNVQAVVVDPTNPEVVFAVGDAIYKSSDGGQHWVIELPDVHARSIAIDAGGKHLLVGSGLGCARGTMGLVWRSTDGGTSWQQVGQGDLTGFAFDPVQPQHVFAGTCGGLMESVDGGNSWHRLSVPIAGYDGSFVAISRDAREVVGALTSEGGTVKLVRSTDGGKHFVALTSPLLWGRVSVILGGGGRITAISNGGIVTSPDGGLSWASFDQGLSSVTQSNAIDRFKVGVARPNPKVPTIIYLAATDGLYRYGPDTKQWQLFGRGLVGPVVAFDVAVTPRSTVFYAGTGTGLFRFDVGR